MIKCKICGEKFKWITPSHLKTHGLTLEEYKLAFPRAVTMTKESREKYSETMEKWHEENPGYQSGEKNPSYIDGTYLRERQARRQARIRDNHTCQKCGMTQEESLKRWGRVLDVLLIGGEASDYVLSNLLTLCCSCRAKMQYVSINKVAQMISA